MPPFPPLCAGDHSERRGVGAACARPPDAGVRLVRRRHLDLVIQRYAPSAAATAVLFLCAPQPPRHVYASFGGPADHPFACRRQTRHPSAGSVRSSVDRRQDPERAQERGDVGELGADADGRVSRAEHRAAELPAACVVRLRQPGQDLDTEERHLGRGARSDAPQPQCVGPGRGVGPEHRALVQVRGQPSLLGLCAAAQCRAAPSPLSWAAAIVARHGNATLHRLSVALTLVVSWSPAPSL